MANPFCVFAAELPPYLPMLRPRDLPRNVLGEQSVLSLLPRTQAEASSRATIAIYTGISTASIHQWHTCLHGTNGGCAQITQTRYWHVRKLLSTAYANWFRSQRPKKRVPKNNVAPIEITKHGQYNNGNIEVIQPENPAPPPPKMNVEEVLINGRRFRVPERIITMDFWNKAAKNRSHHEE